MGKDLHPSILPFIKNKLEYHSAVKDIKDISSNEYYMFKLTRRGGMRDVVLLLEDSYYYSEFSYLSKPIELNDGGFILVAKPEAAFSPETQVNYEEDKIIIGKIGILLGALNMDKFWEYRKPLQNKQK
jgi:hypothetical protein